MSDGFAYLDILLFAMLAAFIAFRLRSVLGRRTGHERRREPLARPQAAPTQEPSPPLGDVGNASREQADTRIADVKDDRLKAGLTEIRLKDPSFDLDQFLQGARAAFAMVIEAFAKGDRAALRPLVSDSVFGEFTHAIDDREGRGWSRATEIVAVRSVEVAGAELRGSQARVTARFASEQINVTRDAEGKVVEGDDKRIVDIVDMWTFERDIRSRDPNWLLAETSSPG